MPDEIQTTTHIREAALPLTAEKNNYDELLEWVGDNRFVLIGEASHGTHEFYKERAEITKRLLTEKGFRAVIAEADWPDAYRVNRFIQGIGSDATAGEALSDFKRFPSWMWRNQVMLEFTDWMQHFNRDRELKAGFYGMDLYSLHSSIDAVLHYLENVDPDAAHRARERYSCFEAFADDAQAYGYATTSGQAEPCEEEVVGQLVELRRKQPEILSRDGQIAMDEFFFAEQNALLVRNAEQYYRSIFRGRASSWNLRDQHMVESLESMVAHLDKQSAPTRVVVWAHNSHLGDARATSMGRRGEWNVGQLMRQKHPGQTVLVGFTTNSGTVTAASNWGEPAERKRVRPALAGSCERLFHETNVPKFLLNLRENNEAVELLRKPRLQRAIGVIYLPQTERYSHYFETILPHQFDVMIHLDETRAVEPLEPTSEWKAGELPETYPFTL
jgi:erythromycin esterase-like protein